MSKPIRQQKLWKNTLDNIDKFRLEIAKQTNEVLPRTILIDRVFQSQRVLEMALNDAKRRKGLL